MFCYDSGCDAGQYSELTPDSPGARVASWTLSSSAAAITMVVVLLVVTVAPAIAFIIALARGISMLRRSRAQTHRKVLSRQSTLLAEEDMLTVSVRRLHYTMGKRTLLRGVSFQAGPADVVAIMGRFFA